MKLAGLLRERLALHATLGRQAFEARMGEEARRLSKFNFGPEMLQAGRKGGGGRTGAGQGAGGAGGRVHAACEAHAVMWPHALHTDAAITPHHTTPHWPPHPHPHPGRCRPLGTSTPAWDPR